MDIALITEGTYPHSHGGVSVWCDQLVRGMPQHRFAVTAIVGNGSEKLQWVPPSNVELTTVPLWGPPRRGRRPRGRTRRDVLGLYERLLECLLADPDDPRTVFGDDAFESALRRLFEVSMVYDLRGIIGGEPAVTALMAAWRERFAGTGTVPTVHDAVTAVDLLEHALRPLFTPPTRADLTHAVTNGLAILPGLAATWTHHTPLLITEHGIYLRERYLEHTKSPYTWPVKTLLLALHRHLCSLGYRTATLITPGNRYNQRWETHCGAHPNRLHTVYNGVDPTNFPPATTEPDTPTIVWVGRIDPIKDLETLIHAHALIVQTLPTAKLRLYGTGNPDYQHRCQTLINTLNLTTNATFEGRIPDTADAYTAGHLVALSSISEGFPYTLIEAMTAARATVTTNVGGAAEAIGDTGLLVPPRNPTALAHACTTLLTNHHLRHTLATNARTRALEHFTLGTAINTYHHLYTQIAATTGGQRDAWTLPRSA